MSTNPSYLRSGEDGEVTQYRDWGIPLGRRFRALKLWFHLRLDGIGAIRRRLRDDLENARWLAQQVEAEPRWTLEAPVTLQTVCVLHRPPGLDGEALDAHTLAWVDAINRSGGGVPVPGEDRRPLDRARVRRRRGHRAAPCRGPVGPRAGNCRRDPVMTARNAFIPAFPPMAHLPGISGTLISPPGEAGPREPT